MKLYEYLTRYGREAGNRLFYRDDEGSLTYGDAMGEARRWADFLTAHGAKGKVAAFRGDNPKDQLLFFLGAEMAGARPVLVHEYLKEGDLAGLFAKRPIDIFLSDRDYPTLSMKQEGHFYIRDLGAHGGGAGDFGVLTSGSSGLPKVLFRRDESWSDFFPLQNTIFEVGPTSGLFVQGSLAFTGNLNMVMGFLSAGASIHLSRRLLPRTWMKRIAKEAVSHVYMIPSKLSPLSKSRGQAEGLAYILTGSQLMTAALYHRLMDRFPKARVILYYGASELSYVSYIEGKDILENPDDVGRPFPGIGVSIRDGEILVDTPYGVEGIDRPFTCHDLGRIDEEGHLHFLGRREDVYHIKGNHVSKQKVLAHLLMEEGVEEAEILAEKLDNGDDRMTAFLVGRPKEPAELVHRLSEKLSPWEIPSRFITVETIPRTSTGKTDRGKLEELAEGEQG